MGCGSQWHDEATQNHKKFRQLKWVWQVKQHGKLRHIVCV